MTTNVLNYPSEVLVYLQVRKEKVNLLESMYSKPRYVDPIRETRGLIRLDARLFLTMLLLKNMAIYLIIVSPRCLHGVLRIIQVLTASTK